MSPTRKFFVCLAWFCALMFAVTTIRGAWYAAHEKNGDALVMFVTALLLFWIGSAIADTLRANPED